MVLHFKVLYFEHILIQMTIVYLILEKMGGGEHCSGEERLVNQGKTYKCIHETLKCTGKIISHAIKWGKNGITWKKKENFSSDRVIVFFAKKSPFMASLTNKKAYLLKHLQFQW